jgi:hypothetical protein
MLNRIKAKLRKNAAGINVVDVASGELVLYALCAYRDQIIRDRDQWTAETPDILIRTHAEIDNVWSQLPVE